MSKFYITTPIYYVNDEPHIGHSYTTILADVLARYHREEGDEVFFLTGTDEHGQKVFQAATERGIEPKKHCDEMVLRFRDLWQKLHIEYDYFIRTTDDDHKAVVREILQRIYNNDEIYFDEYTGLYCLGCERFYTEKELEGGKCPQHQKPLKEIKEKNYFFRMGKYQQRLIDYIHDHPEFIQPKVRKNEVLGFLRQPLGDLCISRPKTRLSWGIELPFDADYVTYVWFDALLNYVSAIGSTVNENEFKRWWPADYHLIGKDILTTHCVYWPTMLFAAGIPQPRTIFAHGWWLSEEYKMSKSLGNVVKPLELIDRYGVDPLRYFLMRDMVLGQDSNFSLEGFVRRYNSDLANDLGNLVGRISTLVRHHFAGKVPELVGKTEEELRLVEAGNSLADKAINLIHQMRMNEAVETVMQYIRSINRYMEKKMPWKLVKSDLKTAGSVLYHAAESLRIALQLLHPIMPLRTAKVLGMIGANVRELKSSWGQLQPGSDLGPFEVPFPRIELNQETELAEEENMTVDLISIEDFTKVDLKTAEILDAEKVEGTDKLLKLQIKVGEENRQIVAGIAEYYSPVELVGKKIIVVANLKPAVIRGVESKGMLLAVRTSDSVVLLTPDDTGVPSGLKIS
ncbi:MAG: methionine--tRNA ligase [Fidelibacterota bacterium]